MKAFILEDEIHKGQGYDTPPRSILKSIFSKFELTVALTPEEAKLKYDPLANYGVIILDHDMEGWPNPDLNYPNCGLRFVEWMVKHKLPVPQPTIYIHSQNTKGVQAMTKLLVTTGYKRVIEFPYGPTYIAHLQVTYGI